MGYVDGYLLAVPKQSKQDYLNHAKVAAEVFKDHGAISVTECWGDDVPPGKLTSFPLAVKASEDEVVVFSWITWPSKDVRQAGMAKAMEDTRLHPDNCPMPFDGQRVVFGGFEVMMQA
ncbi:DUF1428 domain-containing protein [Paraferrimonas sedimenticola]|uniref:RNA signal recognition particle n=1 Tax=Paraferrimonas sedimenticola TaxID=375674 RepID=A0AA37RXL9_9GAMM|nr:DUF1428 domain-containing protein [Paraferrimonas sedimenticola]GLP96487.1 hypothetical protein GCM10007895_17930 [Paraferrimonas sedimenticola]